MKRRKRENVSGPCGHPECGWFENYFCLRELFDYTDAEIDEDFEEDPEFEE